MDKKRTRTGVSFTVILERGNMFDVWGNTDLFLFTSNPIVNKQGLAVMGRGIAKQLADKHPEVREVLR